MTNLFVFFNIGRHLFRKLVSPDYCTLGTLHEGEMYASQGISKIDRLGLLISGRSERERERERVRESETKRGYKT